MINYELRIKRLIVELDALVQSIDPHDRERFVDLVINYITVGQEKS